MATVPYKPVPDVGISQQATPMLDTSASPVAFGSTIASAIESVGKATEKAGDEIFARAIALQELENDRLKTEGETEFMIRAGELRAKYHSTEGNNAVGSNPQYNEDIRRLRDDIGRTMPNDRARKKFDAATSGDMGRHIFSGATHAAQQQRQALEKTATANLAALATEVYNDPSPGAMATARAKATRNINELGDINGWSPEVKGQKLREFESHLTAQRIAGVARHNPIEADRLYKETKGSLEPNDDRAAETAVNNNMLGRGIDQLIAPIVGQVPEEGTPGMTTRDAVDDIERKARALRPDDEKFVQTAITRGQAMIANRRKILTDDERDAMYTINTALGGFLSDGRKPTTQQELMDTAHGMQQAWDKLRPERRNAILSKLDANMKREYSWVEGPDGNRAEFRRIQGMVTRGDPDEINKFLDMDMNKLSMPDDGIQKLIKLQQQTLKKAEGNPAVNAAMNYYRNAQLLKSINAEEATNRTRNSEVRGALVDAMISFQNVNKRPAGTPKDYDEIWKTVMSTVPPPPPPPSKGFWGDIMRPWASPFGGGGERRFEQPIPPQVLQRFKEPTFANRGRPPTADEITAFTRQYRRRQFNELFQGSRGGE